MLDGEPLRRQHDQGCLAGNLGTGTLVDESAKRRATPCDGATATFTRILTCRLRSTRARQSRASSSPDQALSMASKVRKRAQSRGRTRERSQNRAILARGCVRRARGPSRFEVAQQRPPLAVAELCVVAGFLSSAPLFQQRQRLDRLLLLLARTRAALLLLDGRRPYLAVLLEPVVRVAPSRAVQSTPARRSANSADAGRRVVVAEVKVG